MKKERVFSEGSLHVQRSIFKRAFSGVAFRPSNLGLFGSSLQPGARKKKHKNFKEKDVSLLISYMLWEFIKMHTSISVLIE